VKATVTAVSRAGARRTSDVLATEEPCEILVEQRGRQHTIAVTMRTPGNDFELAVGFLLTEGMIRRREDVSKVSYCASGPPEQLYNQVTVELTDGAPFDPDAVKRNFYTSSSCGVCGKASMESVRVHTEPLPDGPIVDASVFEHLPDRLRAGQRVFERTGGLHAAGLFDAEGTLLLIREDVGRHNAVDKLAGVMLMEQTTGPILQVSGRASFEIVQKAAVARIPIVSAVSAPSSLAVALADELAMTLIGFARGPTFNIYTGSSRIRLASAS
jgi:FdhD protein